MKDQTFQKTEKNPPKLRERGGKKKEQMLIQCRKIRRGGPQRGLHGLGRNGSLGKTGPDSGRGGGKRTTCPKRRRTRLRVVPVVQKENGTIEMSAKGNKKGWSGGGAHTNTQGL